MKEEEVKRLVHQAKRGLNMFESKPTDCSLDYLDDRKLLHLSKIMLTKLMALEKIIQKECNHSTKEYFRSLKAMAKELKILAVQRLRQSDPCADIGEYWNDNDHVEVVEDQPWMRHLTEPLKETFKSDIPNKFLIEDASDKGVKLVKAVAKPIITEEE